MGKFFTCCRIQLKFGLRVCLKRWNDRGEFEIDRAKSKNKIAENAVELAHDTDNTLCDAAAFCRHCLAAIIKSLVQPFVTMLFTTSGREAWHLTLQVSSGYF